MYIFLNVFICSTRLVFKLKGNNMDKQKKHNYNLDNLLIFDTF